MPPWHASPKHGKFANDARLSTEEKRLIREWFASGAPEGNPADAPPPRKFVEGWQIGEPDKVVYMAGKPYDVPATGTVRAFEVPAIDGVRVDSGVDVGSEVTPYYDSMLAKVIAHGASREEARRKLVAALERNEWHITRTAQDLGLADHASLLKIMRRHGLSSR